MNETTAVAAINLPTKDSPEQSIAQSLLPYNYDDDRARYLGLRASGFTIREALHLIGKAHSTLSLWRKNEEFVALEARIPEFMQQLGIEYAALEFLRNYRLVLEKDYRVAKASLTDSELPKQDHEYLLKMRTHYTPQQLQIIETLIGAATPEQGFDFTKAIIELSRTETVVSTRRVETRDRSGKGIMSKVLPSDEEAA